MQASTDTPQRYIEDVASEFYSEVFYLARRFGQYSELQGWFQLPQPYRFYTPMCKSERPPADLAQRVVELVQEALLHVCPSFKEDSGFKAHEYQFLIQSEFGDSLHWDIDRRFIIETAKQLERYVKENAQELGFASKEPAGCDDDKLPPLFVKLTGKGAKVSPSALGTKASSSHAK